MSDARIVAVGSASFQQQVARALRVGAESVERVASVTAAEETLGAQDGEGSVIVLSPSVKDPDAVGAAEFVTLEDPTTAVVIVRDRITDGLVPTAMRAGARDVVDMSKGSKELSEALGQAVSWSVSLRSGRDERGGSSGGRRGQVISVFSSKGGTGKTFLASNLATALGLLGEDTAVVDLDLSLGDVFAYFGAEPARPLQDLVALGDAIDDELVLGAGTPLGDHLVGYAAPPDPAAETVSGEAVGRLIRSLRGIFPHTIVDTPAGFADQVLAALDVSDLVLMVAGLDVVSLRHLSVALNTLLSLGLPRERLRIVLNRADSKVGLEPSEAERVLGVKVDTMIPSSRVVPTCLNRGQPVVVAEPGSSVAQSIERLALQMSGREVATHKRRLFGRR